MSLKSRMTDAVHAALNRSAVGGSSGIALSYLIGDDVELQAEFASRVDHDRAAAAMDVVSMVAPIGAEIRCYGEYLPGVVAERVYVYGNDGDRAYHVTVLLND